VCYVLSFFSQFLREDKCVLLSFRFSVFDSWYIAILHFVVSVKSVRLLLLLFISTIIKLNESMECIQLGSSHNCTACLKIFQRKSGKQKYCSQECATRQHNQNTYQQAKRKSCSTMQTYGVQCLLGANLGA
jgi:hypothetical protein